MSGAACELGTRFSVAALPAREGHPGVPEVPTSAKPTKDPSHLRGRRRGGHALAPGTAQGSCGPGVVLVQSCGMFLRLDFAPELMEAAGEGVAAPVRLLLQIQGPGKSPWDVPGEGTWAREVWDALDLLRGGMSRH